MGCTILGAARFTTFLVYENQFLLISFVYNEELHNFYSSPSIIRMIKSRRMRWGGHVARIGEKRNAYRILVGK
jgi:hypothetical protein